MQDNGKKTDEFWNLGEKRERKYAAPDFTGHTIGVTEIDVDEGGRGDAMRAGEAIPPRGETAEKPSPSFWLDPIGGKRPVTASYKRKSLTKTAPPIRRRSVGEEILSYQPNGKLIRKVTVRSWESETEFYGRFPSDAILSHKTRSTYPSGEVPEPVPYFSYVPQYAHMNPAQIGYYRYVREAIEHGETPVCDLAYLQLLIYEIINLPHEIAPADGAKLLARLWLSYRKTYPRLDSYLCEWLPDYCLIGGVPMPAELLPILPEITPKAQLKEFFLDPALLSEGNGVGAILCEATSDYDYKSSRYYADNREMFDELIPAAVTSVVKALLGEERTVFALDRVYQMTRDSYCGAVVSSGFKRRVDLEFCSFTRRADVRQSVTALVKYAENKVRVLCGIKAKLTAEPTDKREIALLDRYFEPMMPEAKKREEDRYMPDDYRKHYEADEHGFDLLRAEEIEMQSWANTERLTGESFALPVMEEEPVIDGEMTVDDTIRNEIPTEPGFAEPAKNADELVRNGLRAALDGTFGDYCREIGKTVGEAADGINTAMLDVLGDIALEADETGIAYRLIEDYREDVEEWLSAQE